MEAAYMGFLSDVLGGGGGLGGLVTGGLLGGMVGSGIAAAEGAEKASDIQAGAAQAGIEEQRRQFDIAMERLSPFQEAGAGALGQLTPFVSAGAPAIEAQQALAGLRGPEAQRAAIDQLAASPEFQAQVEQGERALLQRAAATGGLRGGNVQEALAQFRPQMLSQLISQQYERLGGLADVGRTTAQNIAQIGQSAAAGQATSALQTGQQVAGLLGERGAAQAGGALAKPQAFQQTLGNILNLGGTLAGGKYLGVF